MINSACMTTGYSLPAEHKPGFRYQRSEALGQEIVTSEKTGAAYCKDGVCSGPGEGALLKRAGGKISANVHAVKKIMQGAIVQIYLKG